MGGLKLLLVFIMCINILNIDCYYIKGSYFSFPLSLLIFIHFMMDQYQTFWGCQWRVSDTQVTDKACGPLVINLYVSKV